MKQLADICTNAEKELGFLGVKEGTLEKEAKDWIDESFTIIAHKISIKNHNLIMVVEETEDGDENIVKGRLKYSILRFFTVGGKWRTSVDLQYKNKGEAFQYILDRFE